MVLIFMVVLAAGMPGISRAQVRPKPVIDRPMIYDYHVPQTLGEFMERADAVVLARIRSSRDFSRPGRPRTDYDVEILRVLKEHEHLQSDSKVCRPIGTTEYPDRVERRFQPGFPGFAVGTTYLLFLAWVESAGCFGMAFGPSGVGLMDESEGLKPLVPHPVLGELRGLSGERIEARLASLARRP